MADNFTLEIITPERSYLITQAEEMVLTTASGELALQAHHLDLMATVLICPLIVLSNGHRNVYAISGGALRFFHKENKAALSVFSIESMEEIDISRALRAKENAEELLSNSQSARESARAEVKLQRALNRIRVKNISSL